MAKKGKRKAEPGDVATNRRARHKYEILERFEAGIELRGSEVKSLRQGKAQIAEAYAAVDGGEVWLRGAHIPPYEPASTENHEPERPRKLLLHRREIERLLGKTQQKGLTLVPLRLYFKGREREAGARARARQGAARPSAGASRSRPATRDRPSAQRASPRALSMHHRRRERCLDKQGSGRRETI